MDPDTFQRAEAIFHDAMALPLEERTSFLDLACAADAELRTLVANLLAAEAPATAVFSASPQLTESASLLGRRIGPYVLESQLGEGGAGVVLRGRRTEGGFEQQVAIKLVRLAFTSDLLVQRFTEERRILATLQHPNIARLLDGGVTPDGTPYLVLEYVDGVPLDVWCRTHSLTPRQIVQLLYNVCAPVAYMHQHLVVHRDLKPANILVTSNGEPRLLDFGTARLLENAQLTGATRTAFPMMTLRYASPEQLQGMAGSTRSDVYSLGVILYELLTGVWPYGDEPASELARINAVLQREPLSPPEKLDADLKSILFKALEKDPALRYSSVENLAADLQRYLAGEPVAARGAGRLYRASKFIRRNRLAVAVAAAFAVTLVGATAISIRQARIAERERDTMQQIALFTENLLGASTGMTPIANRGRDLKLVEIIDQASATVGPEFQSRPAVEAGLQATLGGSYMALGLYDKARPHVERAAALALPLHGEAHPLSARVLKLRGRLHMAAGDFDAAANDLAAGLKASPDPFTHGYLGEARWRQSRLTEARDHLVAAHAGMLKQFGPNHTTTATMVNNVGVMEDDLGNYAAAEKRFAEAAAVLRAQPGPPPLLFYPLMGLHRASLFRGDLTQAKTLAEEALTVARKTGGERNRNAAAGAMALAVAQAALKDATALATARNALALGREVFPAGHIEVSRLLAGYARVLLANRQWAEAEKALTEALTIARQRYPGPNWRTAEVASLTGLAFAGQGRAAEAAQWLRKGYDEVAAVLPAQHPRVQELRRFLDSHSPQTQ